MVLSISETDSFETEALRSLKRLLPRLEAAFSAYRTQHPEYWAQFQKRLRINFAPLFKILVHLYGDQYDFYYHLETLLMSITKAWVDRAEDLKALDDEREAHPTWFQSHTMLGGVCYVDLFSRNLEGIHRKIPYFKELGITYLHLMPLFRSPDGENDGGYAISSYREVNPKLGSMAQLRKLASELRSEGISLVLDFVFNHTSSEHIWAKLARQGNADYQKFYWMYPERSIPDAYEAYLREIFPDEHPGAFTYFEDIGKWVWTTFHSNQWDLNYANPEVFNRMAGEMLFLANQGVEILRLDAVAFIWKSLGTSCENLPEAHMIIQAYNAIVRIAAPALLFKSEAIVHPDEVEKYIREDECQLSYNPLLMALIWNTLATREVNLLLYSMEERYEISDKCAWINYVRCHDDIGWTFSDEDAASLGINAFDHRLFLNEFFTGRFEGSFARGLAFQENPKTGDARISGTCASLAGLEKALTEETEREVDLAIRRILLIHNVILSIGGIPLIYLGDEVGTMNDYSYRKDLEKEEDSRWVHRPFADQVRYSQRKDFQSIPGRIFQGLQLIIQLRKTTPALGGAAPEFINLENPHIFGYRRGKDGSQLLIMNNFSDFPQVLTHPSILKTGFQPPFKDMVTGDVFDRETEITVAPYQFLWLVSINEA